MTEQRRNAKKKNPEVEKRKLEAFYEKVQRPGECQKYLKVFLDNQIFNGIQGAKILQKLKENEMDFEQTDLEVPNTIKWVRTIKQKIVSSDGELIEFPDKFVEENYLIFIMLAEEFVEAVKKSTLLEKVQNVKAFHPEKSITLVIFGFKDYCRSKKGAAIGIKQTEIKLAQILFLANANYRMHESPEDLALTVAQFSKSIAEEPFKQKQSQKIDQEQFFIASENKSTENVLVRDTDGLGRLWQMQLCKLPLVSWDISQSIAKVYPMPKLLIEAYEKNSNPANILADIPIIKTGPLSKNRRIGPELSRKIYTLMMSQNPDDVI